MTDDTNFFAMPPSEEPPAAPSGEDGGFTMIGDAAPSADAPPAFAGDVNETGDAFASPPPESTDGAMDFAGAPESDFASPPAEDGDGTPIILGGPPPGESSGMEDAPAPFDNVPDPLEEAPPEPEPESTGPTPMQKWNEEWTATLQSRKDEENSAKAAMVEAAREELEAFQKKREMAREKRMSKNREDEQAKLEAIEADLENDNSWQRVCKMVELSHDSAGKAEDTKRMRDILILLKNEPSRAQAVGAE